MVCSRFPAWPNTMLALVHLGFRRHDLVEQLAIAVLGTRSA